MKKLITTKVRLAGRKYNITIKAKIKRSVVIELLKINQCPLIIRFRVACPFVLQTQYALISCLVVYN